MGQAIEEFKGQSNQVATVDNASARQMAEVQAAMVIARRFPRNQTTAHTAIVSACGRFGLAEKATYAYPKGGKIITGPSIRLAEVLAQNWGNIDFGVIELEQRFDESTVMAYAWDLETNVRQTKVFQVRHIRHTKRGDNKLTDPREIYELVANQGARRVRNCILGVIPGDITEAAVLKCRETVSRGDGSRTMEQRIRDMAIAFKMNFGVTVDQIEKRIGHTIETARGEEIVQLGEIYTSLSEKASKPGDWFEPETSRVETLDDISDIMEEEKAKKGKAKAKK